jgi:hypothetical protein
MPDFDTSVPHIARVYDYWLGGKDNFAADRAMGERTLQAYPNMVFSVRANRAFLARAVRFLVDTAGIGQFLALLKSTPEGACAPRPCGNGRQGVDCVRASRRVRVHSSASVRRLR